MNIPRSMQLLAVTPLAQIASASKVPLRTLYRIKNGATPTLANLQKLDAWAKGRRLPSTTKEQEQ